MLEKINQITIGNQKPEYISIITASRCARIRIDDIEAIEQDGRKIHIITAEKDYAVYETMNNVAIYLEGRFFYRAMKGLIINFEHVKDISGFYVTFASGQCITMGRNNIGKTRQAYRRYLKRYPPYTSWEPYNVVAEKSCENSINNNEKTGVNPNS